MSTSGDIMMRVGDTMSTSGDIMSTFGRYHEYIGGVQYIGDFMGTSRMFSTSGGYHDTCGGYHEYIERCSVHQGGGSI